MSRARVFRGLPQDVLFGIATSYEIAVSYYVIAIHYLGHGNLLLTFREV